MTAGVQMKLLEIVPTIAMKQGEAYVVQCSWCGALLAVPATPSGRICPTDQLGSCPACDPPNNYQQKWWRQKIPVGPFRHVNESETQ